MKITLFSLFTLFVFTTNAQVTTFSQNFDVMCAGGGAPSWYIHNPIPGSDPAAAWTCTPDHGRPQLSGTLTPGVMCSGVYGTPPAYHLDTSYLLTPLLYLPSSTYPGHVFLNFDAKTTRIFLGGELSVAVLDTAFHPIPDSTTMDPLVSTDDSSGWVTHQVMLDTFKDKVPFYLAFRYISTNMTGSTWYIDNVNITSSPLQVPRLNRADLPLIILGNSSPSQITLSYSTDAASLCHLYVYDLVGREVYKEQYYSSGGAEIRTLSGLGLREGMYILKLDNGDAYGVTKVMIQ